MRSRPRDLGEVCGCPYLFYTSCLRRFIRTRCREYEHLYWGRRDSRNGWQSGALHQKGIYMTRIHRSAQRFPVKQHLGSSLANFVLFDSEHEKSETCWNFGDSNSLLPVSLLSSKHYRLIISYWRWIFIPIWYLLIFIMALDVFVVTTEDFSSIVYLSPTTIWLLYLHWRLLSARKFWPQFRSCWTNLTRNIRPLNYFCYTVRCGFCSFMDRTFGIEE